jgi:hypothetical protein
MSGRSRGVDQLLVRMLTQIANLQLPYRNEYDAPTVRRLFRLWDQEAKTGKRLPIESLGLRPVREGDEFLRAIRPLTEPHWPSLWDEPHPEDRELYHSPEVILYNVRDYLRQFWLAPDKRSRDWYIFRAREYCEHNRVQRETSRLRRLLDKAKTPDEAAIIRLALEGQTEAKLDEPPPLTPFEVGLYALQERAEYPSTAPRKCRNENCLKPYFLSERKGQEFCCPECAQAGSRKSKLAYYHKTKGRTK